MFLLHMLLQIVFPAGLEATERTAVGSGLCVRLEMSVQVVPANISWVMLSGPPALYHSLLVCLVVTNTAGEVKHSFMTFLTEFSLQDDVR